MCGHRESSIILAGTLAPAVRAAAHEPRDCRPEPHLMRALFHLTALLANNRVVRGHGELPAEGGG